MQQSECNAPLKWIASNEKLIDLLCMMTQYMAAHNVVVTTLQQYGLFQAKPVGIMDIASQLATYEVTLFYGSPLGSSFLAPLMPHSDGQGYVMMHPEAAVHGQDVMAVFHTLAERASHLAQLPAVMDPASLSTLVTAMKGSDPLSRVRELDKATFGWAHEVCCRFSVGVPERRA